MVTIVKVGEPFDVFSQYNDNVTEMVPVVFEERRNNGKDRSNELVEEALGVSGLSLGGKRTVTKAFLAEKASVFEVGKELNLFINREWCSNNPYPNALDENGKPVAETIPDVLCPDGIKRDLYSRTFLAKERAEDTFDISIEEEEVLKADDAANAKAAAPRGRRTVRERR